jgi:hypothetical protein
MAKVTKDQAKKCIGTYHGQPSTELSDIPAVKFTKTEIKDIIDQPGCTDIRVYLAKSDRDDNKDTVVLVGLNKNTELVNKIYEYGIQHTVANPLP